MQNKSAPRGATTWGPRLAPYSQPDDSRAGYELGITLALMIPVMTAMVAMVDDLYLGTLALAPLAGLLMIRLFIIQHDCGHGSFTSSPRANQWIGFLLGIPTLSPYRYWKRTHAVHHATSGDLDRRSLGDIETLTLDEYRALPAMGRLRYRIYRHPLFLFGIAPLLQFGVKHRLPTDIPASWKREWRDVMWTNLGIALAFGLAGTYVGWARLAWVMAPVYLVAAPVGVWMFYIQHQFEGAYWQRNDSWSYEAAALQGSSFYDLPAILHWFTLNIGFHHIHHLSSRIPSYRLKECFQAVEELQEAPRLGLMESLACARLKLWDEENGCLVGFEVAGP